MTFPAASEAPLFRIYLALAQYPILRIRIRQRMRQELHSRGILSTQEFEARVRNSALLSQEREGIQDPFGQETVDMWETRLARTRSHLIDYYFANNLSFELFEQIVSETLAEEGQESEPMLVSFNPELAPHNILFDQASGILNMPPEERARHEARLREIKVVLIRNMISDQLAYVDIAKQWLTLDDLQEIRMRKIGHGKIGGKSAGMLLARRILQGSAQEEISAHVSVPESYYLGADVMYAFMALNGLMHWGDQKYKSPEQIHAEYPQIVEEYLAGNFPTDIVGQLQTLLDEVGDKPIIVRSSSLLEDNFGTSFAGKYDSYFCPNQGAREENLQALVEAVIRVYASTLNPNALTYRLSKGLQDYDERMAILIQVVQGERFGKYFLPHAAGVAFGRNLYRWTSKIRREDGFLRLVWGLGTRAVDRVGQDYPRLVALSHPSLRPEASPQQIQGYSQQYVDLIDLEENTFKTLPVREVINHRYPSLRYVAEVYQDGFLAPLRTSLFDGSADQLVLTFSELLQRTPFADHMRRMLSILEKHYNSPVDMEFTVQVSDGQAAESEVEIAILQCRPQSHLQDSRVEIPPGIPAEDLIFSTRRIVPHGQVEGIRYVGFVSPEGYYALPTPADRSRLSRLINRLNIALAEETFILVGPGRWGTTNPDLGVGIGYADIYNARALVEVSGQGVGPAPEPSFGTHFFQDLIEAKIYPLAVYLDDEDAVFNRDFFYQTPNHLLELMPEETDMADSLRLIEVDAFRPGLTLTLAMDDEEGRAVAYLSKSADES